MPYQDFIPRFCRQAFESPFRNAADPRSILAGYYNVSTQVISLRIDNLSHEIDQYRMGIPIDRIRLMSRADQKRAGIKPTSYQALLAFGPAGHPLDWDSVIV